MMAETRETDNETVSMKIQAALMIILSIRRMALVVVLVLVITMGKAAKETMAATRAREHTTFLFLIVAVFVPLCPYLMTVSQGYACQALARTC